MPRKYTTQPLHVRFFAKVNFDGPQSVTAPGRCWEWTASTLRNGYGCIRHQGKTITAHLASLIVHQRELPGNGIEICHMCDNRRCCNPNHLFLGTRAENMRDASAKGRVYSPSLKGSKHPNSVLTEASVIDIRHRANLGATAKQLSAEFGVTSTMIRFILNRKNWKHVA